MTAIANDHVVSFNYKLTNAEGETLDQSQGEPLAYLHGAGNIIPGLENALLGKTVGEKFTVTVPAAEGYGEYNPDLVQEVPAQMFQGVDNIQAGMQFQAQTPQGAISVVIAKIEDGMVTVDGNHPLAGQNLNFAVEVMDVRDASELEVCKLPGVVHIPLAELDGQLGRLSRDNTHYLICYAGTRAEQAASTLLAAGFANTKVLQGGMKHWVRDVEPDMPLY